MNRPALLLLAASFGGVLHAQIPASLISDQKAAYTAIKNNLMKAAEKMTDDGYNFKPTPEMQTFAQRIAHFAGQIGTCSALTGERKQSKGGTNKAELVAALKESFDACDAAWDSMNDKSAAEMVAGRGGQQRSKLSILIGNTTHLNESYGYICPYLRLKGIVPPSSDRPM
jgi:hypothetical protein